MLKGVLRDNGPKHRFTDFSKAKICIEMAKNKVQDKRINRELNVQPYKTHDFMIPNTKQVLREQGSRSFTKKDRGELFPVLEEHAFPEHQNASNSFNNQSNVSYFCLNLIPFFPTDLPDAKRSKKLQQE